MSERFFAENLAVGSRARLTGDEARHLAAVMRAKVGDEITLLDGSGAEFTGRIVAISKSSVDLNVVQRRELSRELPFELTLAVALPRGERQKWLVEKATELGVTKLVPLETERGVAVAKDSSLARLHRQVIEASKQCGRNRLMEIGQPLPALAYFSAIGSDRLRLLADPAGQSLGQLAPQSQAGVHVAVGPEGGFTSAEVAAAQAAGWTLVSLGPRILRVETAAVALAACVALHHG
ncbi:MAG: 16S rRNA (uracil(1498)-N(3))-methyltransferase [Planctomycetaceae bacterium]|nr:16S rRNA (uracil(1498)-N(3))-methyltransferase [Planctomycetaceae bacterium]